MASALDAPLEDVIKQNRSAKGKGKKAKKEAVKPKGEKKDAGKPKTAPAVTKKVSSAELMDMGLDDVIKTKKKEVISAAKAKNAAKKQAAQKKKAEQLKKVKKDKLEKQRELAKKVAARQVKKKQEQKGSWKENKGWGKTSWDKNNSYGKGSGKGGKGDSYGKGGKGGWNNNSYGNNDRYWNDNGRRESGWNDKYEGGYRGRQNAQQAWGAPSSRNRDPASDYLNDDYAGEKEDKGRVSLNKRGDNHSKRDSDRDLPSGMLKYRGSGQAIRIVNCPKGLNKEELMSAFQEVGDVKECHMDIVKKTAYMVFQNSKDAYEAEHAFDGGEINGSTIKINIL